MKLKTLATAVARTLSTGAVLAADQSVAFTGNTASFASATRVL
jgi:hypothetical protein